MLVLALDTSTPAVTVALVRDGDVLAERVEVAANRHGELVAPLVAEVLAVAGVAPGDLDAVAAGAGPGPFTGLRVGLMTARAMGHALDIPAYAACSLDTLAAPDTAVVTDARRREVYWATYDGAGLRARGPDVGKPADVATAVAGLRVVGAGAALYAEHFPAATEPLYPSASRLAALVVEGRATTDLEPLYLRRPDAVVPGPPKRVTA